MKKFYLIVAALPALFVASCADKASAPVDTFVSPAISQLPPGVTPVNPPVTPAGQTSATPVKGILAIQSISIDQQAKINSDISVVGTCSGSGCLSNNAEITIDQKASFSASNILKADTINIKQGAIVPGRLEAREFIVDAKAVASNRNPLTTFPELPMFLGGTPGTQNIGVSGSQSLAPGNYSKITVAQKSTLMLAGGYYQVRSVEIGQKATLECVTNAVCVLLVKENFSVDQKSIVRAASTNANDMLIYVEGSSTINRAAAKIAQKAYITANIYAANGLLDIDQQVQATGIFIGKWVKIGQKAQITGTAAPTNAVVKLFEASKAGVIEIPGKVKLEVPANALAEDTVISVINRGPITTDKPRSPAQLKFVGEALEFQPDGLRFSANYTLTMNYDPARVSAIGVTPNDIRIFSAPNNSAAYAASPTTLVAANNSLTANDNHFTLFSIGSLGVGSAKYALALAGDFLLTAPGTETFSIENKNTGPISTGAGNYWSNFGPRFGLPVLDGILFDLHIASSYSDPGVGVSYFFAIKPKRITAGLPGASCADSGFGTSNLPTPEISIMESHLGPLISAQGSLSPNSAWIGTINGSAPNVCNAFASTIGTGDFLSQGQFAYVSNVYISTWLTGTYGLSINANSYDTNDFQFSPIINAGEYYITAKRKGNHLILGAKANGQPTVRAFDPVTVTTAYHSAGGLSDTVDLAVTGNVVYALQDGFPGQIVELDMTNPAAPQPPISSIPVGFGTYHMAQSGNYLVVAEGTFSTPSLRLINIGFSVRGTVSGLGSGLTVELVNNVTTGQPPKTVISGNGTYQNAELIADGNSYNFVVATQPPGYNCTVSNGSGVMDFHNPPVNVNVGCAKLPTAWSSGGNLNFGRMDHSATVLLDGRVLILGGRDGNSNLIPEAEVYDVASKIFTVVGPMVKARMGHAATLLSDGRVLITGGVVDPTLGLGTSHAEIFEPTSNTFMAVGPLNRVAVNHTANTLPNGNILISGGGDNSGPTNLTCIFNTSTNLFSPGPSMNLSRFYTGTQSLSGGRLLIAGGYANDTAVAQSEMYDYGTNAWTLTGNLNQKRFAHAAVGLANGNALITGGLINSSVLSSTEIYESTTGTYKAGPSLSQPRFFAQAVRGFDGRVYVMGGNYAGMTLTSLEIFSADGSTIVAGPNMSQPRNFYTATALPSGAILLVGGISGGNALKSAEILQ